MNGDQLYISNYIRFIFETDSLTNFIPQFVSRCAVLHVQRPASLWRGISILKMRKLFKDEYLEFQHDYLVSVSEDDVSVVRAHGGVAEAIRDKEFPSKDT